MKMLLRYLLFMWLVVCVNLPVTEHSGVCFGKDDSCSAVVSDAKAEYHAYALPESPVGEVSEIFVWLQLSESSQSRSLYAMYKWFRLCVSRCQIWHKEVGFCCRGSFWRITPCEYYVFALRHILI